MLEKVAEKSQVALSPLGSQYWFVLKIKDHNWVIHTWLGGHLQFSPIKEGHSIELLSLNLNGKVQKVLGCGLERGLELGIHLITR